ncbi:hypothetical protein COU19_03345 [Candidatus Kaiserbacteria bacterium CG10_big_fil_rev_8_21_14_0_10_56_12]|uniref:DOD-type homing endonuclease domain-containing protein n=1 Tax=Candidatus Kaiserbacteria bacterium CG10_big_fil_rev_8_21_14_0_10_56_12 TaxID=1974611 RepID=A0A2H0U946_9BACT|nr:MAG: hypothetical protein COU19_03345 [Candidatus Kaiserbacteria bacterium CG10_big_fil_rev_8_21_14_0_10_56_12]
MPVPKRLNQQFFSTWSPSMVYVLGYFAADGSMILNKRVARFIEFTSIDRDLLERVSHVVGSNHKIQIRKKRREAWNTQYRLQIGSKAWFEDLSRLGFTQGKSTSLMLPNIPKKHIPDFVRGYFDGDGCVYFNKELHFASRKKPRAILSTLFTSGSKPFLESLWKQLKDHDVLGGSLQKKQRGFEPRFSHKDSVALHRMMYHTDQASELSLPRKRLKLTMAIRDLEKMRE